MDEIVKKLEELIDFYKAPIPVIEETGPPKFCMSVGTILLTILVAGALGLLPGGSPAMLEVLGAAGVVTLIGGVILFELEHKWWRKDELERKRLQDSVIASKISELTKTIKELQDKGFPIPSQSRYVKQTS